MTFILYMAISRDGFIADINDETPWSDEEWEAFQSFVRSCDVCVMGRKTYETMKADGFVAGSRYVVATNHKDFDAGEFETRSIKKPGDMPSGKRVGIIGGGELNGSLAELGVIDEIILDEEDIELGTGKKLFGNHKIPAMKLLSEKQIGPKTVQKHFKVVSDNS